MERSKSPSCYPVPLAKLQICRLLGLIAPVLIKFLQICRLLGYFFDNEAELEEKDAYLQEFPNLIGFCLGKPAFLQEFLVPLQPDSPQPAPTKPGRVKTRPTTTSTQTHPTQPHPTFNLYPNQKLLNFYLSLNSRLSSHYSHCPTTPTPSLATEPHSRAKSQA